MTLRDVVIDEVMKDPDVVFLTADFGAPALDDHRDRVIHCGIAEQNMIDVAAGLAMSGRKVFCYAMAPFITARCYEQTKCVLSSMNLPVTLIAVGVGFGYDHATLTHFTPEDVAIMRALNHIEILTPCDEESARFMARDLVRNPRFCYLRLERQPLPDVYGGSFEKAWDSGFGLFNGQQTRRTVVTNGFLLHRVMSDQSAVIDLFRIKPIPRLALWGKVVTIEEHAIEGGIGSAMAEIIAESPRECELVRLGLKPGYEIKNGNREDLHRAYGLTVEDIP